MCFFIFLFQVSYVRSVDVYFIVSFAFIFAAVLEYILVLLHTGFKRFTDEESGFGNPKDEMVRDILVVFLLSIKVGSHRFHLISTERLATENLEIEWLNFTGGVG